ncbi:gluconate 2-dehydrogenase subunit 3 family protein [Halioxenophilus aromaticivorans]|uniref:Lactose 3-dehydrogenase subunit gamma LacC n=1 Tax=Halioxenophilus aromaticivorans TaxID=1306992 RepID=A0AAV3U9Q5_9ALTE
MTQSKHPPSPQRRALLQNLALGLGLASLSPALIRAAESASSGNTDASSVFTAEQYQFITQISDLLIPATDTAGAVGAGVPAFINHLVTNDFSSEHQQDFLLGLGVFQTEAAKRGKSFVTLSNKDQVKELTKLDKKAYRSKPPEWAEFYRELKSLVLFGYYTSEPGATQELIYSAVPGPYQGCVPYESIGRAWAT